jgi:hypothetical protein
MIPLLFGLLLFAIVFYAVYVVLGMFPLPAPIKTLAFLLLAVIGLVMLYEMFMGGGLSLGLGSHRDLVR